MSSKRREHDDQSQRRCGGDRKRPRRRKHLYLVLDDWKDGFSVHKMDADTWDSDDDDDGQREAAVAGSYIPEPALLRLESPAGSEPHAHNSFGALGTKMFVFMDQRCALVYDTETAALSVGAHPPAQMVAGFGIVVAAGEALYALSHRFSHTEHSFQAMSPGLGGRWSWRTLPPPPPTFTSRQRVVSYALHPDERTIFMTTADRGTPSDPLGTYAFDTRRSEWRWLGDWALPFRGRGYFDGELDGWVGLHGDGYICCCQVASRSRSSETQLDCQMTKEMLFFEDWNRQLGASLTYMGRGRFCIVEILVADEAGKSLGDRHGCLLNLIVFGLKYSRRGELQIANHRSKRSYRVSRYRSSFVPFALWI